MYINILFLSLLKILKEVLFEKMTNYENDIQVITKNGAEGELTQVSINNGEIENVNTTTLQSEANELNPLAEPVATGQKNIISVDEASSVSSGNNIYINQNNKLMQIDYDTLATAILNKLSTQSFNSLNTSSKLVLDAINELNSKSGIFNNSGSHNSIYRGQSLGSSVTQAQWNAISAGTFDDLYIGDYWTIGGVNWRIAAFDYYYNCGDTSFTKHHAVIVPDTSLYKHVMNDTNTTAGGYIGSKMYTEGLEQAKTIINNAFGSSHVLSHRVLLTSATNNGYASSGTWKDGTVELMCGQMVYGSGIFSPVSNGSNIPYNYRAEKCQLPLFFFDPRLIHTRSTSCWLRDVISSADFAAAGITGLADYDGASSALGVRPAFCIGV